MAAFSFVMLILLGCSRVFSHQQNLALGFYFREGLRAYGAKLVEAEFKSSSLINCNLRCLRSDKCVATNFQVLNYNSGGHCELLLPHELDEENGSIVLSKQENTVYTRIKSKDTAKEMRKGNALRAGSKRGRSVMAPLALDGEEAEKSEKLANEVPARMTDKEVVSSTGSPVPFRRTVMPSHPTAFKETVSSIPLPGLSSLPTSSSPYSRRKESMEASSVTCSIENRQSNSEVIGQTIGAKSSMPVGSNFEKRHFGATSFGSMLSASSRKRLLTPSGVLSFTDSLPHRGKYTVPLHVEYGSVTDVVPEHTMSTFVNEKEASTHVPSPCLRSVSELSTLTYKCTGYMMFKNCYAFIKAKVSWNVAKASCKSSNGQLAIIKSSSKLSSLVNWLEALNDMTSSFHVGIYMSKDSSVKWADGRTVYSINSRLFTTSSACSNNECCGSLSFSRSDFYSLTDSCYNLTSYICQWDG